ncbi:MAG: DUF305 domain-containing protein [Acidobacteria bacterium]|nr:DUF305 domain-containing protein [Acidobacteriota bacterium]
MHIVRLTHLIGAAVVVVGLVGCRTAQVPHAQQQPAASPPIVQPGAPGQASREIDAAQAVDLSKVRFTSADVEFMQGMIGHHAQAVEMVELLKTHAGHPEMQALGKRIELSQTDEIKMMQEWLVARGQLAPDQFAHHHEHMMMPGMLTPEQMQQLAAANGDAFDRLFLQGMIQHHQGAITMVDDLMKQPGAAQESEIYGFVSDVVADQSAEIERMQGMLREYSR